MRSQLRLRVVLPVAVLGLLGVGVGAFAMGSPPEATGAPGTTAATTTAAVEPPAAPSRKAWAARANKLCAKLNSEVRALGVPVTVKDAIVFFEDVLEISRDGNAAFVALGWPRGEKARVQRLWTLSAAATTTGTQMVEALKARDEIRVLRLFKRLEAVAAPYARIVTNLGADRCAEDPFAPADPERGLAGALEENKVVVVLFYTPGSSYDTIQAREARAGAAAAGAGFLAVNVSKDREVASLAAAFQVRDAPAILVVKRGFRVAVRINAYADRETVAQAAENAGA